MILIYYILHFHYYIPYYVTPWYLKYNHHCLSLKSLRVEIKMHNNCNSHNWMHTSPDTIYPLTIYSSLCARAYHLLQQLNRISEQPAHFFTIVRSSIVLSCVHSDINRYGQNSKRGRDCIPNSIRDASSSPTIVCDNLFWQIFW